MAIAHLRVDSDGTQSRHSLEEHLRSTAALAKDFAAPFSSRAWAALAGLWHDLGKYRPGFQRYIQQVGDIDAHIEGKVAGREKTHSAAGALWAEQKLGEACGPQGKVPARVLQYIIAGHHAGLDNWDGGLKGRLAGADAQTEFSEALAAQPPANILVPETDLPSARDIPVDRPGDIPGRFALWVRMLFSCLVDADFLDTECFMDEKKKTARIGAPKVAALLAAFDAHMSAVVATNAAPTPVNTLRSDVLRQCRDKAERAPGVFTLTVPTGGGKTLSSLAFALTHAVHYRKRRVIYAIPYTSIIEQTADIFRGIFGEDNVVEHHSNAESEPEKETSRSRLACENWDAPLVVTTNVQLFESLFARRTSRCRKLHNIVGSVIVLDEAQLLPVEFLQPILDVLRLLVREYGVTLVLCTATQPALTSQESFDPRRGLRGFAEAVTEIIDDVPALYAALKRVQVHRPADLSAKREWPDIAREIRRHEAVLAIVNRRADARELYRLIRHEAPQGTWHLSALMCPQHRSDTISRIKAALDSRRHALAAGREAEPVRVVSTQLVEAGVDMDFPVVYRAMAGLDSIAQAAGRCNREGRLAGLGEVHVFVPPTLPPPGLLRQAESTCRTVWHDAPGDPLDFSLFGSYFRRLYGDGKLDKHAVCEMLRVGREADVRFRDAAEAFRLIDNEDAATVIVRYQPPGAVFSPADPLIAMLERDGPRRWLMRKLQRYGVSIYRHDLQRLLRMGDLREVAAYPGLYVQVSDLYYDPVLGANVDSAPGDPQALVQ